MDIKEFKENKVLDVQKHHPWELARLSAINGIVSRYLKKEKIRGLDIGCGDTFFLNQFSKRHKGEYYAVDTAFTDEMMADLAQKNRNDSISFYRSMQELNLEEPVDIIFLMDVLEHVENPIELLSQLKNQSYVTKNSLFMITVPAYQSLYSNHDKWLGHVKRYAPSVLKKEVNSSGLQVISSGNFFFSLLGPRCVEKVIEKRKKGDVEKEKGIGEWEKGRLITETFRWFLIFDYYIFGKFFKYLGLKTPGLSTYVVCKIKES